MRSKVTANSSIDTRRPLYDGTYPIKIRVISQRVSRLYGIPVIPYGFTKEEFKLIKTGTAKGKLKDKVVEIENEVARAREIISKMDNFSFESFRDEWDGKHDIPENLTLESAFSWRTKQLKKAGRPSSASVSDSAKKSLISFFGASKSLTNIQPKDLSNYLEYMRKRGRSMASVGIYTRDLRCLYNELINSRILTADFYPFGKSEFRPPKAKKNKTSLKIEDIRKIMNYKPDETTKEGFCIDLWLFSYLCSGMNLKDIANLKYKDIKGDFLFFIRHKTERKNRTEKTIKVPIIPQARDIIKKRGNASNSVKEYVFPILRSGMNPEEERKQVQNIANQINKRMKKLASKLELSKLDINGIGARDAFATISLKQGRPLSDISESLGHSDVSVTQHYLGQIQDDEKMEWQNKLL